MTDEHYSGDGSTRAQTVHDVGNASASEPAGSDESVLDNAAPQTAGDVPPPEPDGAENSSGASGGDDVTASALQGGSELSSGQTDQLAALEALFNAIAVQQKQTIDLITSARWRTMRTRWRRWRTSVRTLEQNTGQNLNDNRNGMQ